ncbi:hypothetical protein OUZ56_017503 [Daphnia magna]|uniref:Uncharacterized protein n=1 Tax=Daphnia magna TaxID=35525 RepID=A0ABR0ASW6_9CRUS|nr:hypothetical protein OUZ56_017503 [Daphnia magna]
MNYAAKLYSGETTIEISQFIGFFLYKFWHLICYVVVYACCSKIGQYISLLAYNQQIEKLENENGELKLTINNPEIEIEEMKKFPNENGIRQEINNNEEFINNEEDLTINN